MESITELKMLEQLDEIDKNKIKYFIKLLLQQEKYKKLKKEIGERREEINKGNTIEHNKIWEKTLIV